MVETIVNVLVFAHGPHIKEHLNGAWDTLGLREEIIAGNIYKDSNLLA